MSYKGKFRPKSPEKYIGDVTNIVYRSLWELRLMRYFDQHSSIIKWGSEEIIIPYRSPVDNRIHRYFPDFVIKMREESGKIVTMIIEVKPYAQTIEPIKKSEKSRRYINEVLTYGVNQAKWRAAVEFCKDRNWQFKVMTEKEIGIK
ncbi:head completion protein [uncultured Caudovirales phage]|uniref:Head completion nuclease n=1 Tax=uncultured Caudovirales phage TaxID=2100421 RepID=A0A6J7WTR2_9CAUD|nr:head completion protein [uncultured Caudovirales phage]